MTGDPRTTISTFSAEELADHLRELGRLLSDCVQAGANINFVLPFTEHDGAAFWGDSVLPALRRGARVLWIARHGERIVGSVQLDTDTPPNQPHRAEVTKLLVDPKFRRQGIAKALMTALERRARELGRSLITLDTRTGDAAEPLYLSLGYQSVGTIPGFCRDPIEDRLHPTTVMYKVL